MKKFLFPLLLLLAGACLFAVSFFTGSSGSDDVDVEIQKVAYVMPAAHQVYANKEALDGKHYLFKARIKNNSGKALEDVTVRYRVPGFIEWTELDVIGEMFEGQTAAVVCYPKFKEEITAKMTESLEKAEIEITWDGAEEDDVIEEEFAFRITNRNEFIFTNVPKSEVAGWADVFSNKELLACFVTPNDPIVKYYTQVLQEKVLKGESAAVAQDVKGAVNVLCGIYEATRMSHMVYSSTQFIPKQMDDVSSSAQHNRLPREVITGNTGLCLELSLLYASVLSAAGIDPIIYLIPGHAYPGFKMKGQYYAIEATGIGGEGLGSISDVKTAFEAGQKQLQEFIQKAQMGDPRYAIIDVHALHGQGVTPMNLNDDAFMRKKVDEIAAKFAPGATKNVAVAATRKRSSSGASSGGGNNSGGGGSSSANRTAGPLSFALPSGWSARRRPYPDMPIVSLEAISPDMTANAMVYDVAATSVDEAMGVIAQYLSYMGSEVTYDRNGNSLQGQTFSMNGNYLWKGRATRTNSGIRIVAVGTYDYLFNQKAGTINSIINSIR
ncbi:MAG: hypothetical protein AB8F95_08915 [Bacteroidia bacterium]